MEISNFEADVLELQAKLGKMLIIFIISVLKFIETARSSEEVRKACSCSLLVSPIGKNTVTRYHIYPPANSQQMSVNC